MALYSMSFGFRQPYQVLGMLQLEDVRRRKLTVFFMLAVDSMICSEAISSKVDLLKRLEDVLQGNIKPSA